ncbi:hypothetical protein [Lentibacillus sp.]|uniref:hypothetical protein n=1 Tax=Lentibacillus sp. TaxID=1925746 RepID=UPI002B4AFD1D|nr:hypothetical protein [Lentibacillus sp.]HLS08425.1 hypothetical protein [Lentibacillus sp.]
MKIAVVLLIIVVTALITLYEWPKINENLKKEKRAFIVLIMAGVLLATLLTYFPAMPGPTELIEWVFKPFSSLLPE